MSRPVTFTKKITRILIAAAACFCLLTGGIAAALSGVGLYRNISTFASQNAAQSLSDMNLYIRTAVAASRIITDNESIVAALQNPQSQTETDNIMTQFQLTTLSVYSAQLYDLNGNCYKTPGTEDVPALAELLDNEIFKDFADGSQTGIYWLRTSAMPGIYNNNRYNRAAGMYTFVTKVTDGADTVGYFLMDFNPYRMLGLFFDYRALNGYENSVAYFTLDGAALTATSTGEENPHAFVPSGESSPRKENGKLYIFEKLSAEGASLVVVLPLNRFYANLAIIIGAAAGGFCVCVAGAYLVIRISMKKTLKPLTQLTKELEKTKRQDDRQD
ncbi:MAG: hypothetical protein HPZ86_01580 [Clostridia bacterium]|nr:hypothetical protein [Clostridia bacterium]